MLVSSPSQAKTCEGKCLMLKCTCYTLFLSALICVCNSRDYSMLPFGLFGWWKSRLISADLIVPCERKQAKTSRNKPGKDKRTGPLIFLTLLTPIYYDNVTPLLLLAFFLYLFTCYLYLFCHIFSVTCNTYHLLSVSFLSHFFYVIEMILSHKICLIS